MSSKTNGPVTRGRGGAVPPRRATGWMAAALGALACAALADVAPPHDTPAAAPIELIRQVDYEPWWSPDGRQFVFVSNRNGPMNLYRAAADGTLVERLTTHAGPDDTPAWSPDGRWIAFASEVDGDAEIYLVGADGTGLRRLTRSPGPDLHPTWDRASTGILFNTGRHSANPREPDRIDLCSQPLAGGEPTCYTAGGINTYASWSPDGSTILYRRSRGEGRSQIALLRPGRDPVPLTPGDAFDGWPSWSPDGSRILFASDRTGEFQVHVMNADGSGVRRLVAQPGRYTNPRWSPAGGSILFTGRRPGDGDVELLAIPAPEAAAAAPGTR